MTNLKTKYLLLVFTIFLLGFKSIDSSYTLQRDRLLIPLSEGILNIIPLSDNSVRIQLQTDNIKENLELILINKLPVPDFKVTETNEEIQLKTKSLTVLFNKKDKILKFKDSKGNVFLSEKANSRKMVLSTVNGNPCYIAEQSFDSPENEFLFGLGQFQDGHYNLKNISRKLTQVNTQIAIPFLYSNKGYGILWHQYGITEFNPNDNVISLSKSVNSSENDRQVEVTTTSGTQKISQREILYKGKFNVENKGQYSIMLDLGDMDSRHLVIIDDKKVIDQSNLWLPPAVGELVELDAGEHSVQIVCNAVNTPKLSFRKTDNSTTFRSANAKSLDYVVFKGKDADEVINSYRSISGQVPMLPLWAYGFWQCRERYTSGEHLISTIKEFRKRELPVDVIVQDWQYWGDNGWGVPQFDEKKYPNPSGFIRELHELNAHFVISIWSNPDKNSAIGKKYVENKMYIPNTKWLDYFNPETGKSYWNTLNDNLFSKGVDSWWMDATEPENDALAGTMTYQGPGDFYRLTYPLFVSKSVYEGQRKTNPEKRVAILTRSAFAGQQRYGTINWSGDIGGTWDSFKRQIVAGMNFTLTGMPYWTTDIGGFFRPGSEQYNDENFHELLTRWFQWGAFSTIFRIHGYQTETEPWKYGQKVEDNMREMLNMRYTLMPYIYSEASKINTGSTFMRPLVMDFQNDEKAVNQSYEYMFGKSLLVAPVTKSGITDWEVYLPKNSGWYDFWTGNNYDGGQKVKVDAPLNRIPLFVKSGSILPIGPKVQYTAEKKWNDLEIRIYEGADGEFILYEDEGDNYNYETGKYATIAFKWNDSKKILTVEKQKGDFKEMLTKRKFKIVKVSPDKGIGNQTEVKFDKLIDYEGKQISINL
jgi:alpha-D-xyloside xylohydrolase